MKEIENSSEPKNTLTQTLNKIISSYLNFMGDDALPKLEATENWKNYIDHILSASTIQLVKAALLCGQNWTHYDAVKSFLNKRSNLLSSQKYYEAGNHGIMMDNASKVK